jgi:hypothetical protein
VWVFAFFGRISEHEPSSPVTPEFHHHLQTAEGFLKLGLPNDADKALEDIPRAFRAI